MMTIKSNVPLSVLLIASLGIGSYLAFQNVELRTELDWHRQAEAGRLAERDFLMALIPELNQTISKQRLASIIKNKYPNEEVNVLDDQVQWRFFHFWFHKNGKLETVRWGS